MTLKFQPQQMIGIPMYLFFNHIPVLSETGMVLCFSPQN